MYKTTSVIVTLANLFIITGFSGSYSIIKFASIFLVSFIFVLDTLHRKKLHYNPLLLFLLIYCSSMSLLYWKNLSFDFVFYTIGPIVYGFFLMSIRHLIKMRLVLQFLRIYLGISMIFIFMQYFGLPGGYILSSTIFYNDFMEIVIEKGLPVGLASSPFYMGSQLAGISVFLAIHGMSKVVKFKYNFFAILSGQRGWALFLFVVSFAPKRNKLIVGIVGSLFIVLIYFTLLARSYDGVDRFILWFFGMVYAIEYPFGIGSFSEYKSHVPDILERYPFLIGFQTLIMNYPPHNALINVGILYGIPAVVTLFMFYVSSLKKLRYYFLPIGAMIFVSMFHNLNLVYGDYFFWFIYTMCFIARQRTQEITTVK